MRPVPKLNWGPKILRDYLDRLADCISERTPVPDRTTVTGMEQAAGILLSAASSISTRTPIGQFEARPYDNTRVRIGGSTCNGDLPEGFNTDDNASPYLVTGEGLFWIKSEVDGDGNLTFEPGHGASLPEGDEQTVYDLFCSFFKSEPDADGLVTWRCRNFAFGPVNKVACRIPGTNPAEYRIISGMP